jgi:hypothetical protein
MTPVLCAMTEHLVRGLLLIVREGRVERLESGGEFLNILRVLRRYVSVELHVLR